jgi:hypothetical protein
VSAVALLVGAALLVGTSLGDGLSAGLYVGVSLACWLSISIKLVCALGCSLTPEIGIKACKDKANALYVGRRKMDQHHVNEE